MVGDDTPHRVSGLPDGAAPDDRPVGLTLALGRLRTLGARALRIALPVPGHPLGLSGPPEFNSLALDAGEAVLVSGTAHGFVPEVRAAGPAGERSHPADTSLEVLWHCMPVRDAPPADVPSLGEAERELAEAMREATDTLTRLDVAGSGPVAQAALDAYRGRVEAGRRLLAPGYPPRAVRVLELAQRVHALVSIAHGETDGGREHGAAVSGSEIAVRAAALRPVERTARRAQVAAYNAYAEVSERGRA
ncbi:hypothetical protein AN216_17835 [Streptomyces oceani]|uniref:Uncharacterized protein n=1 Tax=Streptomyces oceani TaxID=1075402 RepID=A0A1E7JZ53_9ACTN|nr:hypothetical protein AN216_17835 [Streptomyces oceani]